LCTGSHGARIIRRFLSASTIHRERESPEAGRRAWSFKELRMRIGVTENDPAGLERKSPTEDADIQEIVSGILAIQAQAAAAGRRPLSRGTHAKGTCVRGVFEVCDLARMPVGPDIRERLGKGIFARPGTYPAIVRFANADGAHRDDRW